MTENTYQTAFDIGKYNEREFIRRHIESQIHLCMKSGKNLQTIKVLRELAKRLDLDVQVMSNEGYYNGFKDYLEISDNSHEAQQGYKDGQSFSKNEYLLELDKLKNEYLDKEKYRFVKALQDLDTVIDCFRGI